MPGSVANLGGGFDTLAVAVQLYLRVRILAVHEDGASRLTILRSTPPVRGRNAIERAFEAMVQRTGRTVPSLTAEAVSDIPMAAGLGSSAAAVVAGLRLFEFVAGPVPETELLAVATSIEGHADNAAAALRGGLTSVVERDGGAPLTLQWSWPDDLRLVVVTPSTGLSTSKARAVLSDTVPRRDAVFNLQRVLSLVHALQSGSYERLREAVQDRWHQPARAALVPQLGTALQLDDPDILGAFLSGAGPSVALLVRRDFARIEELLTSTYARGGSPATVRTLRVHQQTGVADRELASAHGRAV